jgi:hypothetical protein
MKTYLANWGQKADPVHASVQKAMKEKSAAA